MTTRKTTTTRKTVRKTASTSGAKGRTTATKTVHASKTAKTTRAAAKKASPARGRKAEHILAVDVGGTGLKAAIIDSQGKMLTERVRVATPHPCTPGQLVDALVALVQPIIAAFPPTQISIGFPGFVRNNRVLTAPNIGVDGWHDIPLASAFAARLGDLPVRMINDAEMQGFAAIEGDGIEFVLTLGTGVGTAIFRDGELMPHLELAHHPVSKGRAYDQYIGDAARKKAGVKRWNHRVEKVIAILSSLVNYDKLWIGGGNATRITFKLPPNVAVVSNDAGIEGGAKLWHPRSLRETRQLPDANRRSGAFAHPKAGKA